MHRKLKAFWLIVTLALISTLLLPTASIPAVSAPEPQEPTRVAYRFYDFFQGKMDEEVWGRPPEEGGKEWIGRWWWYGTDYVESWSYPVVYQRGSPAWNEPYIPYDDAAYWTNGRLNVVAENLPLNIDTVAWIDTWHSYSDGFDTGSARGTGGRSFVPWNLTLGLRGYPGVGGYCNLSWYMTYTGVERTNYWGWGPDRCPPTYWNYPNGAHDGWFVELNGTITLDKLGAMKVLGIDSTTYDNLPTMAAAWTAAKKPAKALWMWLDSQGNWWPEVMPYAYNWLLHQTVILGNDCYGKAKWHPYTTPPDWPWNLPGVVGIFDLSQWPAKVTVPIWVTGWMLENLVGRWLSDWWSCMGGFMPFEGYYSDLHLNASIGPESTDLVLDTQVDWLLVASDGVGVPCSSAKWVFEPLWGDIPYATREEGAFQPPKYNREWCAGWHYYKNATGWTKSYFISTVGSYNYGGQNPYGYTPSSWNLGIDGKAPAPWRPWNDPYHQRYYYDVGPGDHSGWQEILIFDWSEIQHKGKVPGFHQDPWTILPSYSVTQEWGNLALDPALTWPLSELPPEQVIITEKTLTFIGPIDFAQLSWLTYQAEWLRLRTNDRWPGCPNGVLPWGAPLIYWSIGPEEPICNPAIASSTTSKPVWTTNTRTSNKDYKYGLNWQYKGVTININAIVKNRGTVPCNFTVTASIETAPGIWTAIGSQPVINLPQLAEAMLVFPWNTATASACRTYRIKIEITGVVCQGATGDYIQDNVYILEWTYFTPQNYPDLWYGPDWSCMTTKGGAVKLKLVGDVNDSGDVTWEDLGMLGAAYGSASGRPKWNPEADFDASGDVTWEDLGKLGANYGKSC